MELRDKLREKSRDMALKRKGKREKWEWRKGIKRRVLLMGVSKGHKAMQTVDYLIFFNFKRHRKVTFLQF